MLHSAGQLAVALNRTLVEPCVVDGAVMSCLHRRVPRVADGSRAGDLEAAACGEEPDGLAASRLRPDGSCRHGGGHLRSSRYVPRPNDHAVPLSAYLDWRWLASRYPMIRYHDWEDARVDARASAAAAEAAGSLWVDERGVIGTPFSAVMGSGRAGEAYACGRGHEHAPVQFGGFSFRGHTCPAGLGPVQDPQQLLRDGVARASDADVFVILWHHRGETRFSGSTGQIPIRELEPLPPFNPLIYVAARRWVHHELRAGAADERYGVVQWRSIFHDKTLEACAEDMAASVSSLRGFQPDAAAASQHAAATQSDVNASQPAAVWPPSIPRRLALVADVPSLRNTCGVWDARGASPRFARASASFTGRGFARYEEQHWALDAGLVALREAVIASEADWFFTCSGYLELAPGRRLPHGPSRACELCFYGGSMWIAEVILLRAKAGRPTMRGFNFSQGVSAVIPPLP